ncbi:RNA polymerase sigma-70 factor, ECF subfamily [Erythrobacter litoralis]|uniref:ECF subfamily RNA polymerase sigma-24 factor n=1 Tax=Erythrobacter litoralis TaxID=39960 RepID=A0A074MIY0_9SPHN|nr:sigma-70 family RNA polymerase sigma factor [Erythrobacter litoralis]AOL22947.1 RNA polymerase sigma-70 factor, ECF subfamily [Erythrobacter litoralis]KEO92755.1 ECF subfamily RNA polymerase sigma-24 factor [Erythrobacter litoralis]
MRADDASLSALMSKAQAGDREAYRAVLEHSRDWLVRFYRGRIDPAGADDLVQETLMSIHAKRATYDPSRPFLPWLAAIARYRWVDRLRRTYRRSETELDETLAEGDHEADVVARISIDRMLARLSEGQGEAIRLVKIEGLSIAEASRRTGQSVSLVKVNIHRGLRKLAEHVESE